MRSEWARCRQRTRREPARTAGSPPIAAGYAFDGPALELGALMVDGTAHPSAPVRIPLAMLNRHGLVAGATGTGKTKTLQLMAEQLSAAGVPVLRADIKGDLSGLASAGRGQRQAPPRGPASVGQAWAGDRLPGRVLRARRPGHRHPAAGHDDVVRADPAVARCSASTTPRSPASGWSSTTPTRRACRCSTSRTCARSSSSSPATRARPTSRTSAACPRATAGVILRELIALRRPGRRRLLRRARVRHRRPAAHRRRTAAAS